MSALPRIQAVAFDLDGTLVDSVPDLAASANAMRIRLGLNELPRDRIQSYVGDGIGVLVHRSLTDTRNLLADEALWQQGYTEFVRHYAANLACATRPYPEAESTLALLKSLQLPLAVITNKSEMMAVKLLKELKLDHYFSIVVGGDTLASRKPDPEPLHYVADILGVQPENMLMVGDSENDIYAAKAAGSPVALVSFGYGDAGRLMQNEATRPDQVIDALPEIYHMLRSQNVGHDA